MMSETNPEAQAIDPGNTPAEESGEMTETINSIDAAKRAEDEAAAEENSSDGQE